ncbi:MAG TPA: hypothetical protein VLK33_00950 [Terriglobales bacterium]|nr:hypothetical protein [Terriglobales bacterium]
MTIIQRLTDSARSQSLKFIERRDERLPLPNTHHDQLFYWEGYDPSWGLPNCLREKLLQIGLGEASMVLDACIMTDLDHGDEFTCDFLWERLKKQGIAISKNLIYRALKTEIFPAVSIRKPKPGRPQMRFTVPSIQYLVDKYQAGHWLTTDPLQKEDLSSLKNYRAALHREFIRRHPGDYSRIFLGKRLGVGKSATINYETDGKIKSRPRYTRNPLNVYANPLDLVPDVRASYATWLEIEKLDDDQESEPFRAPPKKIIAALWLSRGAAVTLVTQQTNTYWVD